MQVFFLQQVINLLLFSYSKKRKGGLLIMYREIVTKAVIGKGKISNNNEVVVKPTNSPSKVLGCWIINHFYVSCFKNNEVVAKGKYDLHIWYGVDNDSDTIVHKQTVDYEETFSLNMKRSENINVENELICKCIKYPTCNSLSLNEDGSILVKVEKELHLDVIGEAKLKVQISSCEDEYINDDIDGIDDDYLNK